MDRLPTTESTPPPGGGASRTRIGRRVIALFVMSALIPLGLCAALLYRHFGAQLRTAQENRLYEVARSYGMTIHGRLDSADEMLKLVVSDPETTESLALTHARALAWAKSADLCSAQMSLEPRQISALEQGKSVLVTHPDATGSAPLHLVRQLPNGSRLCVGADPDWLWSDSGDFSGETTLLILDAEGRELASTGPAPAALLPLRLSMRSTADWTVRSWELFLAGRFSSPSWTIVVLQARPSIAGSSDASYLQIFALIVLTILLIAWLSMIAIRRQLQPLGLLISATRRLAQRDFAAFRELRWNDEFGDLAHSFDAMSGKLEKQFAALEVFSDVDRLLLHDPRIDTIIDAVLPRAAAILACERVAIVLFDAEGSETAKVYEYCASSAARLPMRRISQHGTPDDIAQLCFSPTTQPLRVLGAHRLRQGEGCAGLLCLAGNDTRKSPDQGVYAKDFADRLSLIIASIRHAEQLRRQASRDALTGLQNRQNLAIEVSKAVAAAIQRGGAGSLLYIDLDHFKRVNDTSGHAAGDRLLQIVGGRISASVDADAGIARLGGDEFAVLLPSIADAEAASRAAEGIIACLEAPIEIEGRLHQISASIGITIFPFDGTTLEELMRLGDIAMYRAKELGRGKAKLYRPEMQAALLERVRLEEDLKRTFRNHGLVLHYQPIVSSDADRMTLAVEALARWPVDGGTAWIPPSAFIPLAEENGLIVELGHWVLKTACEQFARWKKAGVGVSYTSVNASVRQLKEPDFLPSLLQTLRDNGMRSEELQIEITESVLAKDAELKAILGKIAAQGVRLALDDFGTGYSSLGYLRTFPIDTVKIDRAFIVGVPHDAEASRLLESIVLMCAALGKKVVAEGVELEEQRRYLIDAGCNALQGYLLGRPMDAADIPGFAQRLRSVQEPVPLPSRVAAGML